MSAILVEAAPWQCHRCGHDIDALAGAGGGVCRVCHQPVCSHCGVKSRALFIGPVQCRACVAPAEISPAERAGIYGAEVVPEGGGA